MFIFIRYSYDYQNKAHSFTSPITGTATMECWGAQGGSFGSYRGGYGGYTKGNISIQKNAVFYVYIGQAANRFNGGHVAVGFGGGSGGGTDVRLVNGDWDNATSLRSRVIVAGAGGGACQRGEGYGDGVGGYGGGLTAGTGQVTNRYGTNANYGYSTLTGGTQTSGGTCYWNDTGAHAITAGYWSGLAGSFGMCTALNGQSNHNVQGCGAGGWYGGGSGGHSAGGGGSSFISGHSGCNPVNASTGAHLGVGKTTTINNVQYVFSSISMIDGAGYNWPSNSTARGSLLAMPKPGGGNYTSGTGHTGSGYARITVMH